MATKELKDKMNETPTGRIKSSKEGADKGFYIPRSEVKVVVFSIKGTSPLMQNNAASMTVKGEGLGKNKELSEDDQVKSKVYLNAQGNFSHPAEAFVRAMVRAVTGNKIGKRAANSVLKGSVFLVENETVLMDHKGNPLKTYEMDRRSVVNPNTHGRMMCVRPIFKQWSCSLVLEIDTGFVTVKTVADCLNLAGRIIGVGDFRVEKGGGFGRFVCDYEE